MDDAPEAFDTSLLTGDFGKQFGGSAAANIVTLLLLGIFISLKKLCNRPSRCKSHLHCPCLDVDIMDRSQATLRSAPKNVADPEGSPV